MLTLADVPLALPTRAFAAWVAETVPIDRAVPWTPRAWPGFGLQALAWPTGFRLPPRVRLNRFTWPSGASRWAHGFFLADSEQAETVRDVAFGTDGTQLNTVTLVLDSPDDAGTVRERVTTEVYLLPPTPLAYVPPALRTADAGYLLTVVDARFYWWSYAAPDFGINDSAGITWTGLFGTIAATLGITITVGTIDAAYLQPSRGLNLTYETVPPLLDAACASIGHRLVRGLDGAVATQPFAAANQALIDDATNHPWRSLRAGQDRFLDTL